MVASKRQNVLAAGRKLSEEQAQSFGKVAVPRSASVLTACNFAEAMMKEDRDQRQFFKDLGATAEQTVEEVRGVEENYFSMMQKTMIPLPWIADP
jgi:hypothetical protein